MIGSTPDINSGDNRYFTNSWNQVSNYLANAGIPNQVIPFAAAQVMVETKGLKSNISKTDLNLSGIKYIGKSYQKATKGSPAPEGGNYAKFASYSDWAKDFKRILSLGKNAPIKATSAADFVNRLYANDYFTSSPTSYLAAINAYIAKSNGLNVQMTEGIEKGKVDFANQQEQIKPPVWVWWGAAGLAGIILLNNLTK